MLTYSLKIQDSLLGIVLLSKIRKRKLKEIILWSTVGNQLEEAKSRFNFKYLHGTSPVVQWLTICLPIPGWGTRMPYAAGQLSPRITTREKPKRHNEKPERRN